MAVEPWQLFLAWFVVQLLQTAQVYFLGRKVTRTLMPPPFLRQSPQPPPYAYRCCVRCGELRSSRELDADQVCRDCSEPPTLPPPPARGTTPTVRRITKRGA